MLVHYWSPKAPQYLKSTYLEIQAGGQPPNFQSLNGYNSGVHWSISLKFSTEFQHVTANTWFKVKGSKVKVTAYVRDNADWLRNLCEFVAYLPLTRGVAPRDLHLSLPGGTSQNAIFSNKKHPENADNMPHRLARSRGGLRVAMPSHWFKVKGSKVKVTAYVRDNADWLEICANLLLI